MSGRIPSAAAWAASGLRFAGLLLWVAWRAMIDALRAVTRICEQWLVGGKKALYGLAVARILFGGAMLGVLLSNFSTRLYTFGSGAAWNGEAAFPASPFLDYGVFGVFQRAVLDDVWFTALYLLLTVLGVLFIVGWRFKIVLPVFFVGWVGFIELNDMVSDQSDNLQRIVMILLFFTDPAARWSLDARRRARRAPAWRSSSWEQLRSATHNLALIALIAQVCFVYVSGGLYKAEGAPWAGGWAVYDALATMRYGTWPALADLIVAWGPVVALGTWGSILLQISFPGMLLFRPTRLLALAGILGFHLSIGLLMGLPWFSLTMIGLDSVFIRDRTWQGLGARATELWSEARRPRA